MKKIITILSVLSVFSIYSSDFKSAIYQAQKDIVQLEEAINRDQILKKREDQFLDITSKTISDMAKEASVASKHNKMYERFFDLMESRSNHNCHLDSNKFHSRLHRNHLIQEEKKETSESDSQSDCSSDRDFRKNSMLETSSLVSLHKNLHLCAGIVGSSLSLVGGSIEFYQKMKSLT